MATTVEAPARQAQPDEKWYILPPAEVAGDLEVDAAQGLTTGEAAKRTSLYGPNTFATAATEPRWHVFVRPIPGRHADRAARRRHRQPLAAARARHRHCPALPHALQRGPRNAPGGQGGRGRCGTAEDDDRQGARAARRPAGRASGGTARPG